MKRTVLFVCANNGFLSAMAEALLRRIDSDNFEAASAAIEGGQVNPLAVETMKEVGVDIEGRTAASVSAFRNQVFDFVIVLCDRSQLTCPDLRANEKIHWRLDDPLTSGDPERQRRAFRTLRDQIAQRLHLFVLVQVRPARIA